MENTTQLAKAQAFKALHERTGIFIAPNPWDAGSAKLLTGMGFEALATTSAGLAFSLGLPDAQELVTRAHALENARLICAATHLPVAADLQNGYGDTPEICAETILLAAETGLVGGSIEDATGRDDDPIYEFELAVARVAAAVKAARSLPFPFTLTARAENLITGRPDLDDTIRRLKAFADAGADVLFAPGLKTKAEVEAVVKAVAPKPVNVILAIAGSTLMVNDMAALGVKRISVGSALARAAYGSFINAAKEIKDTGSFGFANDAILYGELNKLFGG
jgi:2-methylisocitrate lyase-like PEP mutase family enzyme